MAEGLLIPIAFFAATVLIVYIIYTTRNRERMAMIEKGADPKMFQDVSKRSSSSLKPALFLIGIGLGVLMGSWLHSYSRMEEPVAFISMMILFGGIGLLVYYFIEGKKLQQKSDE
ncbi:MAG: DUF6249 domain-containing protein [Candidatus Kapaibacterium sp.]